MDLTRIKSGAFLIVGGDKQNVMTIGWGLTGVMWNKKVFAAPVRVSRYTRGLMDECDVFTVSFPYEGTMKEELKYCGTVSGRDQDKTSKIPLAKGKYGAVVKGAEFFYECKKIATVPMTEGNLGEEAKTFYKDGDLHILYIGEIMQ